MRTNVQEEKNTDDVELHLQRGTREKREEPRCNAECEEGGS